ncbi:hypothetical protein VKT23_012669 [Stygiomarasmius scandens]|uniref:F-box domain-containing protein n=1 Tax=Marasmiellus scandens TaxID=2682957 RepID=A0ABR1J4W3_9AGAR
MDPDSRSFLAIPPRNARRPRRPKLVHLDVTRIQDTLRNSNFGDARPVFPNETWEEIFGHLDQPADLLHVIQSCRLFHNLGLRFLYASIEYSRPYDFQSNDSFWASATPVMRTFPKSLTVTGVIRWQAARGSSIIDDDEWANMWMADNLLDHLHQNSRQGIAQDHTQNSPEEPHVREWKLGHMLALHSHLRQFRNLTSLTFGGIGGGTQSVTEEIYDTLRLLTNLTKLALIDCVVEVKSSDDILLGTQWPRLKELTLWRHDWVNISRIYRHPETHYSLLDLMCVDTLRVLRIDWSPVVGHLISRAAEPNAPDTNPFKSTLQSSLRHLQFGFNGRGSDLMELGKLARFVAKCTNLVGLAIAGRLPVTMIPADNNHGLNAGRWSFIRQYSGPAEFLPLLAGVNSQIETLEVQSYSLRKGSSASLFQQGDVIESPWWKTPGFVKCLADMELPKLRSLSMILERLEKEVFYLLIDHFSGLEELKIRYDTGTFDDDTLTSFGAHFLSKMPRLSVFHMYQHKYRTYTRGRCPVHVSPQGHYLPEVYDVLDSSPEFTQDIPRLCRCSMNDISMPLQEADPDSFSSFEELGYIAAWRIYCPLLKEVRLERQFIWKKDRDGYNDPEALWCRSQLSDADFDFGSSWMTTGRLIGLRGEEDTLTTLKLRGWTEYNSQALRSRSGSLDSLDD